MKRNAWRTQTGLIAVVLLLSSAGIALCQQRQGRGGSPEQMVDRQVAAMKERLKLTDEQEKKVKPILLESMKKSAEIRQKYNLQQGERPSEEAMNEMRKSREETTKKLSEVLSKEQMTEYEKMMSERRGGPGGRGKKQ
jgi:hypothetical protein